MEDNDPPYTVAHNVLTWIIDLHDTLYSDQTSFFLFISSLRNWFIMVLHHVDSYSLWMEGLKNNSKGELILARWHALAHMAHCGIVPRHQILDKQASFAYKTEIKLTAMTYKLVPPNDH